MNAAEKFLEEHKEEYFRCFHYGKMKREVCLKRYKLAVNDQHLVRLVTCRRCELGKARLELSTKKVTE